MTTYYSTAVNYKIAGAKYFADYIKDSFVPGKSKFRTLGNPYFYNVDAFFFELFSASELLLQQLNADLDLGFDIEDVKWSQEFKVSLETASNDIFLVLNKARESEWYKMLKEARHKLTHRDVPLIQIETDKKGEVIKVIEVFIEVKYRPKGWPVDFVSVADKLIEAFDMLATKINMLLLER